MKIKKIIGCLLCIMMLAAQITGFAANVSIGGEDEIATDGLTDYARMPDVTASAETWNSQSYTPMQALVEHENYFWYAARDQYFDALTVNLNRLVSVKYIQLLMLKSYSGSYDGIKVEYSTDGNVFNEVCVNAESIDRDLWLNIEFDTALDMQYIRISNTEYKRPAVKYIKVWGESDEMLDIIDVAKDLAAVDASAASGAYAAGLMFDNEYAKASAYVSAESSTAPYITMQLASPAVISSIALCPHYDFPNSSGEFSVYFSKDGEAWEQVAEYTDGRELQFGSMNIIKTGKTEEYSYVKIEKTGGSYDEGSLAFSEVKLISDRTAKRFWVKGINYTTNSLGFYANDGDYASDVRIEFSEAVDASTVNCDSIQLICGDEKHDFEFSVEDNIVTIPQNQFRSDSEYQIIVTTSVSAEDGTRLSKDSSASLKTGTIYNIASDGRSRLINAVLNKPVQYNKVIGLYGTSTEADLKQINDGKPTSGPVLPSSSGTVYYFIDMMNVYETVAITLGERSLGYQTDTANSFIAGSMTMPPLKEDGSIDVEQMDIIYSVSTALEANEVRTIQLDEVKPYRYIALYRTGGAALCFTELGVTAKADINTTEGWSVSKARDGGKTVCEIGINAEVYAKNGMNVNLIAAAFDENDKLIYADCIDKQLVQGNNEILERITIPAENCTVRAMFVGAEDMRMLFDGVQF